MATAIYIRGIEGEQNLMAFNDNNTLEDIRYQLECFMEESRIYIEDAMVSTTRGEYYQIEIEEIVQDLIDWSRN